MFFVVGWLANIFAAIGSAFITKTAGQAARIALGSAIFLAITMGAWTAVYTTLGGLLIVLPPEISIAATWILPGNFVEVTSAYVGVYLVKVIVEYKQAHYRAVWGSIGG